MEDTHDADAIHDVFASTRKPHAKLVRNKALRQLSLDAVGDALRDKLAKDGADSNGAGSTIFLSQGNETCAGHEGTQGLGHKSRVVDEPVHQFCQSLVRTRRQPAQVLTTPASRVSGTARWETSEHSADEFLVNVEPRRVRRPEGSGTLSGWVKARKRLVNIFALRVLHDAGGQHSGRCSEIAGASQRNDASGLVLRRRNEPGGCAGWTEAQQGLPLAMHGQRG